VSSKRRRALYREPVPNSSDSEWFRYLDRVEESVGKTPPPWIVKREEILNDTPPFSGLERQLAATEKLMTQGFGSDTLSEFNRTLTRIVAAWRAVAELPKNANKHYRALWDLKDQLRRDEVTFLTAEPIRARLWITEILDPPYRGLSPQLNEQTGKWLKVESDSVETYYEARIELTKMIDDAIREYDAEA
jgi:hypothetical protein